MRYSLWLAISLSSLVACGDDGPITPSAGGGGSGGDAPSTNGGAGGSPASAGSGQGGAGGSGPALPIGLHAFDGTDVALPYDDLAPFGAMVDGAHIVGLGESVHTSGGFYAAKHRLIRYLVEEKGFRVLAMETPRTLAESQAAPFIDACQGTSTEALKGIFGVFADDNTQHLFEWLCEWNTAHPNDKVRFFGFDVQQPADDRAALGAFLESAAPADAAALLQPIDDACWLTYEIVTIPAAEHDACLQALDELEAYIGDHEAELLAARGEETLAFDRLSLLGLRSWEDEAFYYNTNIGQSYQVRDTAMSTVFETQRTWRFPEDTIVWAHDFHLRKHSDAAKEQPVIHALGSYLFDTHGDDYRPFGLTSLKTGINWPGFECSEDYGLPRPNSLEEKVEQLGVKNTLVDLVAATSGEAPFLPPGQITPYSFKERAVLEEQFRGVFVLEASPPMNAVFWDCQP
ncbi:MAG: erythromycin esterase family protein [Polyangiaceae bacterium]